MGILHIARRRRFWGRRGAVGLGRHPGSQLRLEQALLLREPLPQGLLAHPVVGIARRADVELLQGIEAPELALIRERLARFIEITRIAVSVFHDELSHRAARAAAVRFALPTTGRVRLTAA